MIETCSEARAVTFLPRVRMMSDSQSNPFIPLQPMRTSPRVTKRFHPRMVFHFKTRVRVNHRHTNWFYHPAVKMRNMIGDGIPYQKSRPGSQAPALSPSGETVKRGRAQKTTAFSSTLILDDDK